MRGGIGEVAASFALLGFFASFFFFFLTEAETDGTVAVALSSSPASGGDGEGIKIWTGSAVVQESVSEVSSYCQPKQSARCAWTWRVRVPLGSV